MRASDPTPLPIITIRAWLAALSSGRKACVTRTGPKRLTSKTAFISAIRIWLGGSVMSTAIPALLIKTSSASIWELSVTAALRTLTSSATSSSRNLTSWPSSRNRATASSPRFWSRAPTQTDIPTSASPLAIANPIPLFAPVTSACRLLVMMQISHFRAC
ncbi:hypothetical protein D3C87_1567510 [compost metagenome]